MQRCRSQNAFPHSNVIHSILIRNSYPAPLRAPPFHLRGQIGDGTTSVVIVAAELLKLADQLVREKIHPTSIISGYRHACKEAIKFIQDKMTISTEELGTEAIVNVAKT